MSSISFFGESSDVHIYGGEFNQIRGDMFIFDQSRHSSTVNSFNTTNTIQDNVNNNNSQRYRGIANPPQYRRQRSASPRQPDVASHFPHPTVSPAMAMHLQSQQQLPPGSRMKTIDSFNTTNHTMHNVGNDNSLRYEEPYPKEKRRPSRRHKATYSDGNYDPGTAEDPSSSSPPVPDPRSSGPGRRRRSSPREDHDASEKQMPRASVGPSSMPAHLNWPTQTNQMTESSVNVAPGDVSAMPTVLQVKLEEVLQMALQHVAATAQNVNRVPEVVINDEEEGGDVEEWEDSASGSEDEEPRSNRLNGHSIADGMANLTLNDTLRPAISRVKSAPPLEDASPGPSNHRPPISNPDPRLAESTQDLPAHLRYPFAYTNNSAVPPFSSQYSARTAPHSNPNIPAGAPDSSMYGHTRPPTSPMGSRGPNSSASKPERQPPGPASASFDAQSVPEAFGIQPSFIKPHGGNVVFNDIRGNYNKTDRTVHNTIVGSGNTTSTVVQDSHNDNSVRSYAAPRPGKEKRYRK